MSSWPILFLGGGWGTLSFGVGFLKTSFGRFGSSHPILPLLLTTLEKIPSFPSFYVICFIHNELKDLVHKPLKFT
jgi:hypothetical protein